jgi:hypothetical protein
MFFLLALSFLSLSQYRLKLYSIWMYCETARPSFCAGTNLI